MTEEKRPTLSLKRKPTADTAAAGSVDTPGVVRRKKMVVVTTPPAWKLKKEKLARKAEQEVATVPAPSPAKPENIARPVRYLRFLPAEQAIMTLKAFWPQLFDGDSPLQLATGMREQLFADIAQRDLPLSHKQVIKCLKSLTRSERYLSSMQAGATRYDVNGRPVSEVTPDEEQYAQRRLEKQRLQQARIQNESI